MSRRVAWLAWIGANAAGEMLGLSLVFACGAAIVLRWGEPRTTAAIVATIVVAALLGCTEGAIVGYAQWIVLRRIFPVGAARWVAATAAGAAVAWILGMLPSSFAASDSSSSATGTQPTSLQMTIVAIVIGAAGGIVLSFAQWRVLRRVAEHAAWWLPANAVAWAIAMPFIFALVDRTIAEHRNTASIVLFVAGLALTGAIVGAIHGAVLVWKVDAHRRDASSVARDLLAVSTKPVRVVRDEARG